MLLEKITFYIKIEIYSDINLVKMNAITFWKMQWQFERKKNYIRNFREMQFKENVSKKNALKIIKFYYKIEYCTIFCYIRE